MQNYLQIDKTGDVIELIGAVSMSCGFGLDMDSRYSADASRGPQGLYRRSRETPATCTIQCEILPQICAEWGKSVFGHVADVEAVVGQKIRLVWLNSDSGEWVVKSAQFSGACDPHVGISQAAISLSLMQTRVENPQPATAVRRRTEVATL